jgi:hypothetical protein
LVFGWAGNAAGLDPTPAPGGVGRTGASAEGLKNLETTEAACFGTGGTDVELAAAGGAPSVAELASGARLAGSGGEAAADFDC